MPGAARDEAQQRLRPAGPAPAQVICFAPTAQDTMIRYALRCSNDHAFDSWFQSAEAFEKLQSSGHLSCSVCGSQEVTKSVMAPRVATSRRNQETLPGAAPAAASDGSAEESAQSPGARDTLRAPAHPAEQALAKLRDKILAGSEDVGRNFVREARRIHDGEAPSRPIYGEARLDEARKLAEDGVPVAPLPFIPPRKRN